MKLGTLAALCLLLLAGCSGFSGESASTATPEGDEPWKHAVVIENGFGGQEYSLIVETASGQTVLNKTRYVESGDRWIAARLTESEYSDQEYVLKILAEEASVAHRSGFDATPKEKVTYTSGATIYKYGPDGTGVYNCGGNVTCHTQLSTE